MTDDRPRPPDRSRDRGSGDRTNGDADGAPPARHDWSERTLGWTVVSAVASGTETDPTALPPLYDVVDPDALERLFRRRDGAIRDSGLRVSFEYGGHDVMVDADGSVFVRPAGAASELSGQSPGDGGEGRDRDRDRDRDRGGGRDGDG
jgi:hypothetical protein